MNIEERKIYNKIYREKNKVKLNQEKKDYYLTNKEEINQKNRNYYSVNKEKSKARIKKYQKLNREKVYLIKRKMIEKYPEKIKARVAVRRLKMNGVLKALPCEICSSTKTEAHHDNYNLKEKVRWLCSVHHGEFHKNHLYNPNTFTYYPKL